MTADEQPVSLLALSSQPRRLRQAYPQLDRFGWVMLSTVIVVSILVVVMPAIVFWLSLRDASPADPVSTYSFGHYIAVFGSPFVIRVLANTLVFTLVSLFVSFLFGLPAAWLVERTDLPGKPILYTLMTIGLLMPGFAEAMGWLFLLHPRIGIVNQMAMDLFGLRNAPFDIASNVGMGWVMGLSLAPLAFIMTAAVLRAIDPALEESAQVAGADFRHVIRRVTLPLAWPGVLAAGIYIFTIGFAAFDVPAIIGWSNKIFTFSTYLLLQLSEQEGLPNYGAACALSTIVIAIAGLLIWWYRRLQSRAYRYQVVTGKGYRPRPVALGRQAWTAWLFLGAYFVLSKLLPLLVIIWASLLPYFRAPSAAALKVISLRQFQQIPWDLTFQGIRNTSILMLLTPTVTIAVAVAFSWVVLRSKLPGRGGFDFIAFLPHAVPNIVFGFAILLFALFFVQPYVPVYGTIGLLLFVFVMARLSYATRMVNSTLIQLHRELEEAAAMTGARTGSIVRRISLPLLAPTLVYAWLWMALLVFRELTLAVLLTTQDNITLPVVVWNIWLAGGFGAAAALTLVLIGLMVPLIAAYWWVVRRRGLIQAA